jgi:hypothetical protein
LAKLQEDWVLCRVFYKSRTTTARPARPDEAASLLSGELLSLPLPQMPPADAYLAAFDHGAVAGIGGYYHQDDDAGVGLPASYQQRPDALPLDRSLASFRDLLSSMVEEGGGGAVAKTELHHQDWTEAAYAQQQGQGGALPHSQQPVWNPFLSSG